MAKQFDTERFNRILREHNQQLRAEKITGKQVVLSNGLVLDLKKEVDRCKKRVLSGHDIWKNNFDQLYSLDQHKRISTEAECKSLISKIGGINCQRKHGEKVKFNLNTGIPWNKGTKGNYPYSHQHSKQTKEKISNANLGQKNGMFGKKLSAEQKAEKSKKMKELILSGKFTPNSNNRNTHWESFYNNKKYRSSWEALYQYLDNQAEYETLRIPYIFDNQNYVYIVDFVNHETKTVVEVKPQELINDKKTQAKISAAKKWCNDNGYVFVLADKNYFISRPIPKDLTGFDIKTQNKIRKIYEIG